jgi:hypothetical protein
MKSITHIKKKVILTLDKYQVVDVQMTEGERQESLTIIFDHQTHSSKLKNIIESLKAQKLNCQCSFSPETWELALTISK